MNVCTVCIYLCIYVYRIKRKKTFVTFFFFFFSSPSIFVVCIQFLFDSLSQHLAKTIETKKTKTKQAGLLVSYFFPPACLPTPFPFSPLFTFFKHQRLFPFFFKTFCLDCSSASIDKSILLDRYLGAPLPAVREPAAGSAQPSGRGTRG